MDNLEQLVVEKYPKIIVQHQQSPSYIEMHTKHTNDVLMICMKNKPLDKAVNLQSDQNRNTETEELELTGSPLKLDLSLHAILDDTLIAEEPQLWKKDEALHYPISIKKAREIANLCNETLRTLQRDDVIPVWILTNPSDDGHPLLLTIQSDFKHFTRGIVAYQGALPIEDVNAEKLLEDYATQEKICTDLVDSTIDCKYLLSGISYGSHNIEELLNAPHNGVTELHCRWKGKSFQIPFISCKVYFEQEVIIGHMCSPCNPIWKSLSALHYINQMLIDMTAAGSSSVDLETAVIRNYTSGAKIPNNTERLNELLSETETYAYTAEYPAGGCICVTDYTATLKECFAVMAVNGSSNDFTYRLWDILKDCQTAEELITLLIQALKFISSGKIRPFIDANNKTYLSKLVLKLSRGHSQTSKVLKNLRTSPPQALSLVAQVGIEKTMWEYTRIMSLVENSFYIAGIWTSDSRSHESIEQINQTIQDMTMGGDFNMNPFDSLAGGDQSIRLEYESFCADEDHELTVDDFASLKKHGLVAEKKDANEVPLITDEIDISPWKNILMKFSQVHVCLEHLYRAETWLRADFASLKPVTSYLLQHYVSEKSPIKTIGQLMSDPVQKVVMPIVNNTVQDQLKKPALWYRLELSKKEGVTDGVDRDSRVVHVISQLPVFPPSVWQNLEPSVEDAAEVTTTGEDLKYYCTKYTYLSNEYVARIKLP
ncbi:hypothetical protein ACJJTC_014806 [Scirpophaga incertulas]